MVATLPPDHLPRYLCPSGHEQWTRLVPASCLHGGCDAEPVRVRSDGKRYGRRQKVAA